MRSATRLSKEDNRGRNKGRRTDDAVEIMQVWKADSSINEDVCGVLAETAVKVCGVQQYTQRPEGSRVLYIKGVAGIASGHHECL